jgi:hypothetical protein
VENNRQDISNWKGILRYRKIEFVEEVKERAGYPKLEWDSSMKEN